MRAMGHSSVTVSQKHVHPTPETMERVFQRLEAMNQRAIASLTKAKTTATCYNFCYSQRRRAGASRRSPLVPTRGGGGTGRRKGLKITFPIWYRLVSIGTKGLRVVILQPWLLQAKQYSLQSPCSYAASSVRIPDQSRVFAHRRPFLSVSQHADSVGNLLAHSVVPQRDWMLSAEPSSPKFH